MANEKIVDPDGMTIALDIDISLVKSVRIIGSRSEAARAIARDLQDEMRYIKQRLQSRGYAVRVQINTNRLRV